MGLFIPLFRLLAAKLSRETAIGREVKESCLQGSQKSRGTVSED